MMQSMEDRDRAPVHVVLVTGGLEGGGAERVLSDMANYWAGREWRVTFATWAGPEVADFFALDPRVERVWVASGRGKGFLIAKLLSRYRSISKLRALLESEKPDAVLSFINTSNVQTILAAAGLKTRVVVSERVSPAADSTVSPIWRLMRRAVYHLSDVVVAQTEDSGDWIRRYCRAEVVVIPNPLRSMPEIRCAREPLIVAVGRLRHQKGFDLLIRAFSQVASRFEDWHVLIIGDGKERESLVGLRDELMLTERVEFLGHIRDVEAWMARAGLVVQPSRFEGFPNVVLESMAMSAPVISTDCPSGPSELIEDGINGRLVPTENVTALATAMAELMSNPQARESLGREAVKTRQRYQQQRIMAQWEACLLGA